MNNAQNYFNKVVKPATNTKATSLEEFRGMVGKKDSEKISNYLTKKGYDGIIDRKGVLSFEEPQIIVLDLKKINK